MSCKTTVIPILPVPRPKHTIDRAKGTVKRPFKALRRAWKGWKSTSTSLSTVDEEETSSSPPPYDGGGAAKPLEKPVETPPREPVIDPEVHAEGCRILHKRSKSEGLCEECRRWRDWHEGVHVKYQELRKELGYTGEGEEGEGRGGRYARDTEVDGFVEVPVEEEGEEQVAKVVKEWAEEGKEEEGEEHVEEDDRFEDPDEPVWEPVEASIKKLVETPFRSKAKTLKETKAKYSAMSVGEKREEYEKLCEKYHELVKDRTLSKEGKKMEYEQLARKLRVLGGCYMYQPYESLKKDGETREMPFELPKDRHEQYIQMYIKRYDERYYYYLNRISLLWKEAHEHAMRNTFTHVENYMHEEARKEDGKRTKNGTSPATQPRSGRAGTTDERSMNKQNSATASGAASEELRERHKDLLKSHKDLLKSHKDLLKSHSDLIKIPAELEKKRAHATPEEKKKQDDREKEGENGRRAAAYFSEVAEKDTDRVW